MDASLSEEVGKFVEEGLCKVLGCFVVSIDSKKGILCSFELAEGEVISIEHSQ